MIPVTTFAGKTVAVFGLGGSGLTALRPAAPRSSPSTTIEKARRRRQVATADLRKIDWSKIAALVLAPGVPLTHPAPHWSVVLAQGRPSR